MKNNISFLKVGVGVFAGVLLNIGLMYLVQYVLKWPLFMDTLGSISVAFVFGGVPAIICAILSEIAMFVIEHYYSAIVMFYGFSVFAAILVVCIFRKSLKASKSITSTVIILFIISILMIIAVSVVGGIVNTIDVYYQSIKGLDSARNNATSFFQADLFKMGFSSLPTYILSRFPSNLIERPVTVILAFFIWKAWEKFSK